MEGKEGEDSGTELWKSHTLQGEQPQGSGLQAGLGPHTQARCGLEERLPPGSALWPALLPHHGAQSSACSLSLGPSCHGDLGMLCFPVDSSCYPAIYLLSRDLPACRPGRFQNLPFILISTLHRAPSGQPHPPGIWLQRGVSRRGGGAPLQEARARKKMP